VLLGATWAVGRVVRDRWDPTVAGPDHRVLGWFVEHRPDGLVAAMKVVTQCGNLGVLLPAALLAAGWCRRRQGDWSAAGLLTVVIVGVRLLVDVGKRLVDRPRPPLALHLIHATDAAFPSGHAAQSAAVWGALAVVVAATVPPVARIAVHLLATALVIAVGLSRLVLGVHWPTDVLAGWALGAGWLAVALAIARSTGVGPPSDQARAARTDSSRSGTARQ